MKLRSVLLALSLIVFVLPIVGFLGLRVYDTQLVRQTQAELLAQGAVLCAAYREALREQAAARPEPPLGHDVTLSTEAPPLISAPLLDHVGATVLPRAEAGEAAEPADTRAIAAAQRLTAIVEATKRDTLAGIRLLDNRGVVVGTSGTELGASLGAREEVTRALAGTTASVLRQRVASDPTPAPLESLSRNTGWRVFVALPVVDSGAGRTRVLGAVVVSRTPMTLGGALWQDRWFLTTSVAVMLVVVLLVSLISTSLIARPVAKLKAMAEALTRGETPAPPRFRTPEELAALADAWVLMARTLETRASYIKTFAAAVSHEFKTPLTSMRGAIELLSDHLDTMPLEQRKKFLLQLHGDAERLDRLVRRLLELARADTATTVKRSVEAMPVLERLAAQKSDAALEVRVEGIAGATLPLAEETLETIVSNLLDNARQHARAPDGHVIVTLTLGRDGDFETLSVADNGPGISPANAQKIFEPFFTTARDRGGTGLGLNICKTLVEAAGGTLVLSQSERGACFVLRFPAPSFSY